MGNNSFSKDLENAFQDVVVSVHNGVKILKKNEKVKKITKNTTDAFDTLGKQLEKDFDELSGKKQI